ncbi:MAG: hypothetical protein QM759_16885 [Terricaulis sp.]
MFGPKRNPRPVTRTHLGCFGALFLGVGSFFLWAMAVGARDPHAPVWAIAAAFVIAISLAMAGGWLLLKAVFWDGDARR